MPQLLQVMPDESVRHKRPECSGLEPGPRPWQGSAANNPEAQSQPASSAALSLMFDKVTSVMLAVAIVVLCLIL